MKIKDNGGPLNPTCKIDGLSYLFPLFSRWTEHQSLDLIVSKSLHYPVLNYQRNFSTAPEMVLILPLTPILSVPVNL